MLLRSLKKFWIIYQIKTDDDLLKILIRYINVGCILRTNAISNEARRIIIHGIGA